MGGSDSDQRGGGLPAPSPTWVRMRAAGHWLTVTLAGLIDLGELRSEIDRLLCLPARPERLIVDLNAAEFTDVLLEAALLVDSAARLDRATTLIVACGQPRLLHWFEAAAPQIRVVPTIDDALRMAGAHDGPAGAGD